MAAGARGVCCLLRDWQWRTSRVSSKSLQRSPEQTHVKRTQRELMGSEEAEGLSVKGRGLKPGKWEKDWSRAILESYLGRQGDRV